MYSCTAHVIHVTQNMFVTGFFISGDDGDAGRVMLDVKAARPVATVQE